MKSDPKNNKNKYRNLNNHTLEKGPIPVGRRKLLATFALLTKVEVNKVN